MFIPVPAGRRVPPNPAAMRFVFGLILAAGLVGTYLLGARPLLQAKRAERWESTPCRIVWSRLQAHRGSKGRTNYSVGVAYTYAYGGTRHQGSRYDFRPTSPSAFGEAKAIVDRLPPGTETTCWVDPSNPSESVLERSVGSWVFVGLFPLFFVGIGIVGLMSAAREQAKQRPRPSTPRSAPPPEIPPGPGAIHPR